MQVLSFHRWAAPLFLLLIAAPVHAQADAAGQPTTSSKSKTEPSEEGKLAASKKKSDGKPTEVAGKDKAEIATADADEKGKGKKDQTAYVFGLPTADGKNLPMSEYKGKVLLIVNLARQSSYATQLPALQKLSETYKDKGLVVLGVPSNDFGNAEPGTAAEVAKFYGDAKVSFPVLQLSSLTGVQELPLFTYLSKNKAVENDGLHWNYTKFLVDRQGKVIVCFPPDTAPDSLDILANVREALDGTWKPKKPKRAAEKADEDDGS